MRALLLLGVLGAAGGAFFSLVVLGGLLPRRQAHLLFAFFLVAFAGADALIHATSAGGTRFERFMIVATVASGIGAAAAALAPLEPRLRLVVWGAASVLFVCPTFAGHALDADQPSVIAPAADLLHLGGAAVWLGGVASLVLARTGTAQRFAQFALPAVAMVALGGAARALTELSSVSQFWTTGYGRALVLKTALFATLLALAWLARRRFLPLHLALLTALAVSVGALTDLRPGRARGRDGSAPDGGPAATSAPGRGLRRRRPGRAACGRSGGAARQGDGDTRWSRRRRGGRRPRPCRAVGPLGSRYGRGNDVALRGAPRCSGRRGRLCVAQRGRTTRRAR